MGSCFLLYLPLGHLPLCVCLHSVFICMSAVGLRLLCGMQGQVASQIGPMPREYVYLLDCPDTQLQSMAPNARLSPRQATTLSGVAPGAKLSFGYRRGTLQVQVGMGAQVVLTLQNLQLRQLPQSRMPPQPERHTTASPGPAATPALLQAGTLPAGRQGRRLLLGGSRAVGASHLPVGRKLQGQGDEGSSWETSADGGQHLRSQQQLWCSHQSHRPNRRKLQGQEEAPEGSAPEIWTLLLWGVKRPLDTTAHLALKDVELLLPPAEHAFLLQAAAGAASFDIPLKSEAP